ncbi:MAG: SMC-Scp complex subunit ScpB, partial [Cyanobacteria bacterium J06648_11]
AIVLKGSVTQSDLVEIRGSGVYQHVPELVEKGFITKQRQPGNRSSILRVTDKVKQRYSVENGNLEQLLTPTAQKETDAEAEHQLDLPTDATRTENNDGSHFEASETAES